MTAESEAAVRERMEAASGGSVDAVDLHRFRAGRLLEVLGTPAALARLERLASGTSENPCVAAADAALGRMKAGR